MLRQAQHDDTRNGIDRRFSDKREPMNLRTYEPYVHIREPSEPFLTCPALT